MFFYNAYSKNSVLSSYSRLYHSHLSLFCKCYDSGLLHPSFTFHSVCHDTTSPLHHPTRTLSRDRIPRPWFVCVASLGPSGWFDPSYVEFNRKLLFDTILICEKIKGGPMFVLVVLWPYIWSFYCQTRTDFISLKTRTKRMNLLC